MLTISVAQRTALMALCVAISVVPKSADATWSIVAADTVTKRVAIATATCVPQSLFAGTQFQGLMDVQGVIAPDAGAAVAQAASDPTGRDQALIYRELKKGTPPLAILKTIEARDKGIRTRQFGMVDVHGRSALFSGEEIPRFALARTGWAEHRKISYYIKGNTLRSEAVITNAVRAFEQASGSISDRALAALEAGDATGGDRRCSCETAPRPKKACTKRHALMAYLLVADPHDMVGTNHEDGKSYNDGKFRTFIYVTDQNTREDESADPVETLRMRYEALKKTPHGAEH